MITTPRLRLRPWKPEDLDPFARMCADPRVMEYFESTQTRADVEASLQRMADSVRKNGFSFWAAELIATREFIGFIGLHVPTYPLPFSPCTEIGWRLAYEHWGKGYAQEGARASLDYGFRELGLPEIVALTAVGNQRSRHVMERIGMKYDPSADFDHPKVPEGHPVRRHVLYRIQRPTT